MPHLWTRIVTCAVLLAIGATIGMFYTERKYRRAATPPLIAESYVKQSACPTETLQRMNALLSRDGTAVPSTVRRELKADRRALIADICPPGRREPPDES
jgi:hypothetical protein